AAQPAWRASLCRRALSSRVQLSAHVKLPALMEMIIDGLGHLRADAGDPFEIGDAGATHGLGRAEMLEQRAFPRRSDARNLVERGGGDRLLALGAMRADGKSVRLVPELLDAIEHGVARLEQHRLLASHVNALAAGVAVGSLGDGCDLDVVKAELIEHGMGGGELARAAVDQNQVGRGPSFQLPSALGELAEASRQ